MSSLPFLDAGPSRAAGALLATLGSDEVPVSALPASSPTDSSGGVDVVETPVSFRGPYGHIDMIVQRPTGQTSSLRPPLPGLATRSRAKPASPSPSPVSPPAPATTDSEDATEELPGYAPYNPGPYRTLPSNLDLNDPLASQFIRGIANIRRATTQIDEIDTENVRLLSRQGQLHLGGGIPAAREARRALRAAEQELHEAFESALAAVQQNRTDEDQLAYLGVLLEHLEGWIADTEIQTANYARRMENTVAYLRQTNAQLHRENQELRATVQESRSQLQRRTMRIQYLEYEVAEMAGYN